MELCHLLLRFYEHHSIILVLGYFLKMVDQDLFFKVLLIFVSAKQYITLKTKLIASFSSSNLQEAKYLQSNSCPLSQLIGCLYSPRPLTHLLRAGKGFAKLNK